MALKIKELKGKVSDNKINEAEKLILNIREMINLENYDRLKEQIENLNQLISEINIETSKNKENNISENDNKNNFIDIVSE